MKTDREYFWGFTIVILRVPDIFSDAIRALSNFGYEYRISKTDAPWSDTYNSCLSVRWSIDIIRFLILLR